MKGAQMMYDLATFRRPSQFMPDDPNRPTNIVEQNVVPHTSDIEGQPETPAPSNFEIDDEFNLPISVALTILIIYMFAGAVVYFYWEEWDFFASFYFVFISMSTIGFGDYVPRHPICMIVSIIYLVFGLALMSMCINVVQVKLSDTFRQASTKLGATIGLAVSEEDGSITAVPPPTVEIPDVHSNNTSS